MSISRRIFLKVLGSGLAATGLTQIVCKRSLAENLGLAH